MKVVSLPKAAADEKLVALLQELLEDARAGTVQHLAGVMYDKRSGEVTFFRADAARVPVIGALQVLVAKLIAEYNDHPEAP